MTVSSTTTRHSFNGTGASGPFSISFTIQDASHIQVYWDKGSSGTVGTPVSNGDFTAGSSGYLVKDVHYSVQNAGTSTDATITLLSGGWTVDSTLQYATSVDTFTITRNIGITQTTDYQNNSAIDAETLENSFDKITQIVQQVNDDSGYSIKFSSALAGSTGFNTDSETASTINQNKSQRSNNLISFDSNGDIIATQEIGSWKGNWATGTTYVERDLVKDSETGAVYLCIVGHNSGTFTTDLSANKWDAIIDAGGFNVKLSANLTIDADETHITPYKLDLNGKTLTNNGTLICAEIITGDGTLTGSGSTIESGPVDISSALMVTLSSTQTLTNKTLTSPDINTPDIDGGSIDGTTIGSSSHTTGKFTTCDATTDFTIGGTVVTDGQIADDGNFTFDINGDLTVDVNGGDVTYKDNGTTFLAISYSGGNTTITGP